MKRFILMATCMLAFAACGDDSGAGLAPGADAGGGADTGGPAPGPANQIDAEITDGGTATPIDGESEETNEVAGGNYAAVAGGVLTVSLISGDGTIVLAVVEPSAEQLPGSVSITGEGPDGTFVGITGTAGIFLSTGGAISVNQCPTAGAVITGTWDNITLTNVMGGTSPTLTGSFRATVSTDDGSITCATPDTPDAGGDAGGSDTGGGDICPDTTGGACEPFAEAIATCQFNCVPGCIDIMNPMDPFSGCEQCLEQCVTDSGALDDPACASAYDALDACDDGAGCTDAWFEDDSEAADDNFDLCIATNCCDEYNATF